jgi:sterol desaturase/sphingolipid hydroxylase (fatty acid hydroxylase superfamily)
VVVLRDGIVNAAIGFVLLMALFVPLERSFSARAQRHLRTDLDIDLAFFLFQYIVMASVLLAVTEWLERHVLPWSPGGLRSAVEQLPLCVQALLVVVLGDLGLYWAHRLSHSVPWLWRFHAVHHSVETLDWVAAHREHPLDGLYSHLFLTLPAVLLGVGREEIMAVYVFRGASAVFVHTNVRMPLGPFGFLFGDPVLHRWHHARVERTRHNFANLAPYLDVLFGTHYRPDNETFLLGVQEVPGRCAALPLAHPALARFCVSVAHRAGEAPSRLRSRERAGSEKAKSLLACASRPSELPDVDSNHGHGD